MAEPDEDNTDDLVYFSSNVVRMVLALGIINALPYHNNKPSKVPPIMYGRSILERLTPEDKIAINSERLAILEVKKITEMKTNNGKSIATICGIKPA